jgi:MFS transporter, DHA2 family, multidrug resistance protein
MVLCGLGWALMVSPNSRALMVSAPKRRSGAASGVTAASRNFGQTLGTAMTALIFGLFAGHATTICLQLGVVLGAAAALLSFRRHAA